MSDAQRIKSLTLLVKKVEPDFNQLAQIHGAVNFEREASFALQILKDNNYLSQMAATNQDSLKQAIINVAAIGLTLSPVHKLAYLVPRDRKVMLDISYRGYVQLAIECGAIMWALAEVVREKDTFIFNGMGKEPTHKFQPFQDRGPILGAYCVAKTRDGEYITTMMSMEEIEAVRNRSQSWKAYQKDNAKTNPWVTDESEMIKKTVIRRAYKTWPMTDGSKRFDQAIDVTNQVDPVDMGPITVAESSGSDEIQEIRDLLSELEREESAFIEHLARANKRTIKKLEDLTAVEVSQAIAFLKSFADKKKAKEAKELAEAQHEDAI